jgi:hypothetical protein
MFAHIVFANNCDSVVWASSPHVRIDKITGHGEEYTTSLELSTPENIIWSGKGADEWNKMREKEIQITMNAMESVSKRSVKALRAVALIHSLGFTPVVEHKAYAKIPDISRDQEIRGQSWAIMAIIGDPDYENARRKCLDDLGTEFFEMIKNHTNGQADNTDEDALQLIFENLRERDELLKSFNEKNTVLTKHDIDALPQHPQIAIFGFGDDPDVLKERASKLSQLHDLKHANIAVVRMYSWLKLNFVDSHKIEHTSRLPIANSFFKAMRDATK